MFDRRIVDEISNSKGYSIALLTTFNFEISYFERAVLNSLYDKNIKNVEIFVEVYCKLNLREWRRCAIYMWTILADAIKK